MAKTKTTEKTEKTVFGRQIYSMEKCSFFFFGFFSFPIVLVLATRCIPLAKFG